MAYVYALSSATPLNTEAVSLGAGRIRDTKGALMERLQSVFVNIDTDPMVGKDATWGTLVPSAATKNLGSTVLPWQIMYADRAALNVAVDPGTRNLGLPNLGIVRFRNNAGSGWVDALTSDSSDRVKIYGNVLVTSAGAISGITTLTATTVVAALTGNASTATVLQTARLINGVSFNGSADITVSAATVGTLTFGTYLQGGAASFSGANATISTNATSANTASTLVARGASGEFSMGALTATTAALSGALTYGGVVLTAAVTGTGNMVLSASPTFTGTVTTAAISATTIATSSTTTFSGTAAGTLRVGDASFADAVANVYGNGNTQNIFAIKTSNDGTGGKAFIVESSAGAIVYSINSVGTVTIGTGSGATLSGPGLSLQKDIGFASTFGVVVGATRIIEYRESGTTLTLTTGALRATGAGSSNGISLGSNSGASTYGILTFNNAFSSAGAAGITAGGDSNMNYLVPTGGTHNFRVNDVVGAALTSSTLTVSVATTAVQALTATTEILSGNSRIRNDAGFYVVQNTTGTVRNVLQIGTVPSWTGAGSATDGAIGAFGSMAFYTNDSTTAAVTIATTSAVTFAAGISATTGAFSGTISGTSTGTSLALSGDVTQVSGKKYYYDGGGDSYWWESAANVFTLVAGGANSMVLAAATAVFAGTIASAAPTGGAGAWKFGVYTGGGIASTGRIRVEVNGVNYDLLAST